MKHTILAAAILAGTTMSANAETLGFDDFIVMGGQIQNGNCPFGDRPCILLNPGAEVTISLAGDELFDFSSFAYTLQGTPSAIEAMSDLNGLFQDPNQMGNSGDLIADLSGVIGFESITSVTFDNIGTGSLRIGGFLGALVNGDDGGGDDGGGDDGGGGDDPAAVPLPAAGMMLLTALGAAAAMRRRS